MRLIDADKLKKHYSWWETSDKELFDEIVDAQPTVDAIPIDWIKETTRNWLSIDQDAVTMLVDNWEDK